MSYHGCSVHSCPLHPQFARKNLDFDLVPLTRLQRSVRNFLGRMEAGVSGHFMLSTPKRSDVHLTSCSRIQAASSACRSVIRMNSSLGTFFIILNKPVSLPRIQDIDLFSFLICGLLSAGPPLRTQSHGRRDSIVLHCSCHRPIHDRQK